jgi:hypothetical protein
VQNAPTASSTSGQERSHDDHGKGGERSPAHGSSVRLDEEPRHGSHQVETHSHAAVRGSSQKRTRFARRWVPGIIGTVVFMMGLLVGEWMGVRPSFSEIVTVLIAGGAAFLAQALAERQRTRRLRQKTPRHPEAV